MNVVLSIEDFDSFAVIFCRTLGLGIFVLVLGRSAELFIKIVIFIITSIASLIFAPFLVKRKVQPHPVEESRLQPFPIDFAYQASTQLPASSAFSFPALDQSASFEFFVFQSHFLTFRRDTTVLLLEKGHCRPSDGDTASCKGIAAYLLPVVEAAVVAAVFVGIILHADGILLFLEDIVSQLERLALSY